MTVRKARFQDVPGIHRLVSHYAAERLMLPRPLGDIYENVWEFTVAEEEGRVVGCGALRLYSNELAEIRSLCVDASLKSRGIGKQMVEELLHEAKVLGLQTVFALTIAPAFFEKLGFRHTPREKFPDKVWQDCLRCALYSCCNETALSVDLVDWSSKARETALEAAQVSI